MTSPDVSLESEYLSRYDHLAAGIETTCKNLEEARATARQYIADNGGTSSDGLDILAFGSMARREMHQGSDFDWLLIAHDLVIDPRKIVTFKKAAWEVLSKLGLGKPGSTGIFGTMIGAADLVNTIGLDRDTNLTHTRRILVLQESVSLLNETEHRKLLEAITRRYLFDQHPTTSVVPRFLLNDIVRYWRTVAVDYQAKRWQEVDGDKWGLRLLKLRGSRKLTFAGTVVSALRPELLHLTDREAIVQELVTQWTTPALTRLAQLRPFLAEEDVHLLDRVFEKANALAGFMKTHAFRKEAEAFRHPRDAAAETATRAAYLITNDIDEALRKLLLHPKPLQNTHWSLYELTSKYLIL